MVIFDLDGTLALIGDRRKYIDKPIGQRDWQAFFNACGEDKVNRPIANIFHALQNMGHDIKIVTGRMENVRAITVDWLHQNNLYVGPHNLHMRAEGDHRHDTIIKPELIAPFKDQIEMMFEDRATVVEVWRKMGLTCLQVADGKF